MPAVGEIMKSVWRHNLNVSSKVKEVTPGVKQTFDKLDFEDEDGRQEIYIWSERRQRKFVGVRKSLRESKVFAFDLQLLQSFIANFNFMVVLQMILAALITYACQVMDIAYDVHVTLFVSPIVFPLAFSINTDFQRREKVLEDLALFKSSSMMWFFCLRDWREACQLDDAFMKTVRNKLKCLLFHLREYLLTEKLDRRRFILRVIYEDLSDVSQLNEKVRSSQMNANSPLVSRIVHFINMMCLAFERLRVIREYRSPRSIRSFTKVLIFVLPLILSPYYIHLGRNYNPWSPYYISVMVAFVFGALQGVQDKLDDPFDGMSEDDINLDTLDEWTSQSLEATVHRTYTVGRFHVSKEDPAPHVRIDLDIEDHTKHHHSTKPKRKNNIFRERRFSLGRDRLPTRQASVMSHEDFDSEHHPYAGMLNAIQGNTTIMRGGHIKVRKRSTEDNISSNGSSAQLSTRASNNNIQNHAVPNNSDDAYDQFHARAFMYEPNETRQSDPQTGVLSYMNSLNKPECKSFSVQNNTNSEFDSIRNTASLRSLRMALKKTRNIPDSPVKDKELRPKIPELFLGDAKVSAKEPTPATITLSRFQVASSRNIDEESIASSGSENDRQQTSSDDDNRCTQPKFRFRVNEIPETRLAIVADTTIRLCGVPVNSPETTNVMTKDQLRVEEVFI